MLVLYVGRRGAGKTISLLKDAIALYNRGWTIYSNFDIAIPYKKLENETILNIAEHENIKDCVILIDEIQLLMDSRRSMKKGNLEFSYFVQQIRKRGIILLMTTQFSRTTDLRIREHVDILVKPKYISKYPVIEASYFDLTSEEDLGFLESKTIVYNPIPLFNLYNTYEIKKSALKLEGKNENSKN